MAGATERYWTEFVNLKRDTIYFARYREQTHEIDWSIDVFKAIASSGSIGAWVVWRDLSFLWGAIIAASQVFSVLKEFLPYKRRLKSLHDMVPEFEALTITAEQDWVRIEGGKLTEEEINEAYFNLKRASMKIKNTHFANTVLPERLKLVVAADLATKAYIETFYGAVEDDDDRQG